jgi:hypothetical protein
MDYGKQIVALREDTNEMRELDRLASERTRQTIAAAAGGAIIGWFIGVGQLIVIGSWALVYWPYVPMIPLYSALGWALFGMIVGGSGVFGKSHPKTERTAEPSRAA